MKIDRHNLPTDIPILHSIIGYLLDMVEEQRQQIVTLTEQVSQLTQQNAKLTKQVNELTQKNDYLTQQNAQLTQQNAQLIERVNVLERQLYGKSSEQWSKKKLVAELPEAEPHSLNLPENDQPISSRVNPHGRRPLPDNLTRVQHHHDLPTDQKTCGDCGSFLSKVGMATSEQLDSVPQRLYVIQHYRHKYICRKCQNTVITAPMPPQVIDKGLPAAGLLAQVIVDKYQDHLPLYRQAQRFKRHGVDLHRSTLCGWMMHCAALLQPLVDYMTQRHLLTAPHLFTDDTPIGILKESGESSIKQQNKDQSTPDKNKSKFKAKSKKGRFWVYTSKGHQPRGDSRVPACTVYHFTPGRHAHYPLAFLKTFKGHLQADAYSGYNPLYQVRDNHNKQLDRHRQLV